MRAWPFAFAVGPYKAMKVLPLASRCTLTGEAGRLTSQRIFPLKSRSVTRSRNTRRREYAAQAIVEYQWDDPGCRSPSEPGPCDRSQRLCRPARQRARQTPLAFRRPARPESDRSCREFSRVRPGPPWRRAPSTRPARRPPILRSGASSLPQGTPGARNRQALKQFFRFRNLVPRQLRQNGDQCRHGFPVVRVLTNAVATRSRTSGSASFKRGRTDGQCFAPPAPHPPRRP